MRRATVLLSVAVTLSPAACKTSEPPAAKPADLAQAAAEPSLPPRPLPQVPDMAGAPASVEEPGRWYRVKSDEAIFLFKPKGNPDALRAFLGTGQLAETRALSPGAKVPPNAILFDFDYPNRKHFKIAGPIVFTQLAAYEPGYFFRDELDAPPFEIPPRAALCKALGAYKPALAAEKCEQYGRFVLLDRGGDKPRHLAAFSIWNSPEPMWIIDLAGKAPKVVASAPTTGVGMGATSALPGGRSLLVLEEVLPGGNQPSGTGYSVNVVGPDGKITREPAQSLTSTQPRGELTTQFSMFLSIDRSGPLPVVSTRGDQFVQEIATGKILSKKPAAQTWTFDTARGRMVLATK